MPLEKGAAAEPDIAAFARMPLARAVRRLIQGHVDEPGWCLRPDFVDGVRLLAKYDLGFEICIFHPQMARCDRTGAPLPGGELHPRPHRQAGHQGRLARAVVEPDARTGRLPNVVCKISGVVTEADHKRWTYDEVAPYVAHAIECFGFDRVAFGGDWPVMELATRYPDWVAIVDRVTAGASTGGPAQALSRHGDRLLRTGPAGAGSAASPWRHHRAGRSAREVAPGRRKGQRGITRAATTQISG